MHNKKVKNGIFLIAKRKLATWAQHKRVLCIVKGVAIPSLLLDMIR